MNAPSPIQEELIANYGNCPSQLEAAISGLSASDLDLSKDADSWSIREIIHHIADGDDLWKLFIKRALGNPHGEFSLDWYWEVPQDDLAQSWRYQERAIEPSLAMFRANRAHIVQLLTHTPGALEKSLRVRWPQIGERDVPVRLTIEGQTQHVLEHIAQIGKIREAHGI